MKTYQVYIIRKSSYELTIEAQNETEAKSKALEEYNEEDCEKFGQDEIKTAGIRRIK